MLLNLLSRQIIVLITLWYSSAYSQRWESGLRQRYDGYGEDWIFMPDGNGQPQVAVLKVEDSERSGILDGSEIAYIIYTRYLIIICIILNNKLVVYVALFYTCFISCSFDLASYFFFKFQSERRHASDSK